MPAGRPSSYLPEYCQRVIELGETGASIVEMAYELDVSRPTLEENWPAAHPEFLEALNRAKVASQTWWERKGRSNLEAQSFQASMWSRSMAARFPDDWRESKNLNHSGEMTVTSKEQRDAAVSAATRADG
jgi:transposase